MIQEYPRTQDPLIRRAAVQALGQITENAHIGPALQTLIEALDDANLGNRVAACDALGTYGSKMKPDEVGAIRNGIAHVLIDHYQRLAYSTDAGAQKENNERKDFRLAILRNIPLFGDSPEVFDFLAGSLDTENLDDGALRLGVMTALGKVTKKNYGANYELWSQYVAYRRGEVSKPPKEISSLAETISRGDWAILK